MVVINVVVGSTDVVASTVGVVVGSVVVISVVVATVDVVFSVVVVAPIMEHTICNLTSNEMSKPQRHCAHNGKHHMITPFLIS